MRRSSGRRRRPGCRRAGICSERLRRSGQIGGHERAVRAMSSSSCHEGVWRREDESSMPLMSSMRPSRSRISSASRAAPSMRDLARIWVGSKSEPRERETPWRRRRRISATRVCWRSSQARSVEGPRSGPMPGRWGIGSSRRADRGIGPTRASFGYNRRPGMEWGLRAAQFDGNAAAVSGPGEQLERLQAGRGASARDGCETRFKATSTPVRLTLSKPMDCEDARLKND